MSRAKRHHQAPQAYLKNFADEDGRLDVYDRIGQKALRRQHASNVAVVSNLYSFEDTDGNPSDAFEQGPLARIDGDMGKLLPKLLEPMPQLTRQDQVVVNTFLVLQFMRTTAVRDFVADSLDFMLRFEAEMNVAGKPPAEVERFIKQRYPNASIEEKATIRAIAADPKQPVQLPAETWIQAIMRGISKLAPFVLSRDWHFVDPVEGAFLSCDNPIVLVGPQPVGLGNAASIFWPLSPTRGLWRGALDTFDGRTLYADWAPAALVTFLNQATANQATRQIYWHPETNPAAQVRLPAGPLVGSVNGMPIRPGENSYDKIREDWLPIRDGLRAKNRQSQL